MEYTHIILPTPADVRAARVYLDWGQNILADKIGVNVYAITSLETGRHKTGTENLKKIAEVFLSEGIKFNSTGGFNIDKNIVTVYEGKDCYLKLLDDIITTCAEDKKEVLFLGSDDKKSSQKYIDAENKIYASGIPSRNLVNINNDFILGPLKNYRQINSNYFMSNNVVAIYDTKVAFPSAINKQGTSTKTIIINEAGITNQLKNYFNNLWEVGKIIRKSSTKQIF